MNYNLSVVIKMIWQTNITTTDGLSAGLRNTSPSLTAFGCLLAAAVATGGLRLFSNFRCRSTSSRSLPIRSCCLLTQRTITQSQYRGMQFITVWFFKWLFSLSISHATVGLAGFLQQPFGIILATYFTDRIQTMSLKVIKNTSSRR